jgi:outer membrane lipoprotein LolB
MNRRALLTGCVLAALIAGCRTLPVVPPATAESWEARRALLQGRQHFEIKGRVAVAAGQDGFTASLRWIQSGTASQLSLDGPLGVGGVRVTTDGTVLTLVNPRGEHLDSDAARAELKARLGFDAPLASLRYWILGVPDPASTPAAEIVDAERRLTNLEQNGWQIDYADYVVMNGEWLPGRMTLHRADVRVRLIVDHWDS